jgi:hypothetical protein
MSARPSTSRTTGEANSGSNNNSSGSNLRGRKAGDASDLSHKENADNQNVQGEQGRGLPAHVMYPQGVKQRPMTAPPSEQPQQQVGQKCRPVRPLKRVFFLAIWMATYKALAALITLAISRVEGRFKRCRHSWVMRVVVARAAGPTLINRELCSVVGGVGRGPLLT